MRNSDKINLNDICIQKMIERFEELEELIEAYPFLSLKEAAGVAGYDGLFSRICKRVRQTPLLNF